MSISPLSQNKFSNLNIQDITDTFGLKIVSKEFPLLELQDSNQELIQKISSSAKQKIEYWNEQELIIKHISAILELANLEGENYNTFAERNFGGRVDDIELSGTVDFLVARGTYEPRTPYFFIQEYKKFKQGSGSDPLAQLLGEMLVAQVINSANLVYGAYIVGQYWRFVVLDKREYFVLDALDSTDSKELTDIFSHLNWVKEYVKEKLK